MSQAEVNMNKSEIETILGTGVHTIEFYKVDGSVRTMSCTRDMDLIPVSDHPKSSGRASHTSTVTVYDMVDEAWKSFIVENLISIDSKE